MQIFSEAVYTNVGKCTKRAVARLSLDKLGWKLSLFQSFHECKTAIAECVTLVHQDDSKQFCTYTTRAAPIGRVARLKFHFQTSPFHTPIKHMNWLCSTLVYSPPLRWDGLLCKKRPTPCLPPPNALTGSRHALRN